MISDVDMYHGVVLRQLVLSSGGSSQIGVADLVGRVDTFHIDKTAFQIKHSTKRLSPWQFTYAVAQLDELSALRRTYVQVWAFFVCGRDGVVALSFDELESLVKIGDGGTGWLRVSRS